MILRRMRRAGKAADRSLWSDLISLGLIFPISITLGFFLGRWIGGWFGHPQGGGLVGLLWGIAAAFWELYKVARKVVRWDAEETRRLEDEAKEKERHAP